MARFGNGPYNAPPGTLGSVNERVNAGMTVSGRAFGGDLPSASTEPLRILQRITPGYDSRGMARMGANEEAIIMDRNFGIGTGVMSSILEGHVVPPSEADGWDDAPPTSLSNISDPTNVAVPVVRRCRAPNLYDLPGEGEVLFLHKPFHGSRRISTKRGAGKRFNLVNAPGVAAQRGLQGGPLAGFNARALEGNGGTMSDDYYAADAYAYRGAHDRSLNRILFEKQWQLFQENPKRYSELTPLQIWYCYAPPITRVVCECFV